MNYKLLFLPLLLSSLLLSDAVRATSKTQDLQIAQQPTQPDATRAAAQQAYNEGFELYKQGTAESLQQAIAKWQTALPLWQKLGDKSNEALTLLGIGTIYNSLGEKQQALSFFNQALPLYRAVDNRSGEATTLNNIGAVYSALGEKQQALSFYNQALPLYRAVGDRSGVATTLNNIGLVYDALGEKQQALSFYNQALPLYRTVGDRSGVATTLNNIGLVYSALGEKQQALSYYNQALPLYRAVGDRSGEALTLNNIGAVYSDLGEKQQALSYYNQALPLRRAVGDRSGEALTLNNIGAVYSDLGEKQQALSYYNQALPLRRAVGDRSGEATTLNNIGKVYSDLGEKQQALSFYNQALPIIRAVGDRTGEAGILNNIGAVYDALGEKQQALSFYNQALPILRAVGDRTGEATTLNNIGLVYSDLGEKQKALSFYNQALPLIRAVGDRTGEARTLNNIGAVYDALGEKHKALEFLNQALPLWRAVGDRSGEALTLSNIAFLERDKGNLQTALTQIEASIKIIEELRTKIDSQELRTSYFATVQNYYQFYIDLLMQLHKKEPSKGYAAQALHISERSRARVLLELLTEANAKIRKGVDPKLLAQEQSLQEQIDAKDKLRRDLISKAAPATTIQELKQEIANLLNQYKQLQTQIRTTSPKYAALKDPEPLKSAQIQQQLDANTVLLQYSLGKERSYLWVVTPNSLDSYELPPQTQIEKAANDFRQSIVRVVASPKQQAAAAKQLSHIILAPVANKLANKRLVIVADGVLQNIPFAAITDPTTQESYQPLLVNHEIVNLPSASTIAILRQETQKRPKAPKALAILADPVYSANDSRVTGKPEPIAITPELDLQRSALSRSAKNLNRNGWDRLTGTREEAQTILKLGSAKDSLAAYDFDANYDWVTNSKLNQYRVIHFATHGFADDINPELSGIVLSLVDKQGKPQRGYLRLNDIFNLDFPADLIVLSACQTGQGKEIQGEGLVGLTRGLMYAGSPRLVLSLWDVDDEGTKELMSEFYRQMWKEGKSPVAALRAAQLSLWQSPNWRKPVYWAAFTLQGEWR
ncbi:CHAT domain-containing tetratricopeptide repeat protein [Aulosira sp. FACHB-615]|uniref:CHAT domain-containing tetratricopeptide repeat protein n=1 Tax=Aulosira sp. FACHB-615 TaxID=2692777 RepID=UPI001682E062|nr:CHAT domain-containing tetratricopeptide repeat protein [Aulosira sp. FACHB-615]MBD2488625.1 tetratricopeptide repeat protein [Aulosira sp. FACHB-615]